MLDTLTHKLDSIGSHLSSQINEVHLAIPTETQFAPAPEGFVNTKLIPTVVSWGLDKWDFVAIIIGLFSLWIAYRAFKSQRETERNTMKITVEGQFGLLIDYVRHFYANLVVSKAMLAKLGGRYSTHYLSQEHFRKLQDDTEALHPEAFVHSDDKYQKIHNLLVLIRNFNLETEVAELHVCDEKVPVDVKERDLNTLIFKQNLFCERFIDSIRVLCLPNNSWYENWALKCSLFRCLMCLLTLGAWDLSEEAIDRKHKAKQEDNFKKLIERTRNHIIEDAVNRDNLTPGEKKLTVSEKLNIVIERWKEKCGQNNAALEYFTTKERESNNFAKILFANDLDLFFQLINSNINWEIIGKNSQGFDKIAIIPFKPEKKQNESTQGS